MTSCGVKRSPGQGARPTKVEEKRGVSNDEGKDIVGRVVDDPTVTL